MKDATVQKVFGKLSSALPDKATPHLYRPDYTDFLDGSGYPGGDPGKNAGWRCGFARESALPRAAMGDVFISGGDAKARRICDVPNRQEIRAVAVDDGSGRGVHVFAVIDCAGLSNARVKEIRAALRAEIESYNILSLNVFSNGRLGGADTVGLWGDLAKDAVKNLGAGRSRKAAAKAVSGRNADVMDYLRYAAGRCVRGALASLAPGALESAGTAAGVLLRFTAERGGQTVYAACRNGVLELDDRADPAPDAAFAPVPPVLDVFLSPLLIPADNAALLLAARLRLVDNPLCRITLTDDDRDADYYYCTEAGVLRLGGRFTAALIPTSADGFGLTGLQEIFPEAAVLGQANDTLGYRQARRMLNGAAAKLPLDAGRRTQTEINFALRRIAESYYKNEIPAFGEKA